MATPQGPMSGFRDLLAEQMIPRQQMFSAIQSVFEGYGFTPLSTPALERYATLQGKYGEAGEKLIYKFKDNGGRVVALRYDLTVPLCRVVAQYRTNLPMPYKRYAVGPVWRGESPQAGRYREFTQFDADIVGSASPAADAEIVAMMYDAMQALGAEAEIRVNNRKILDALVEKIGLADKESANRMIGLIDKVEKIGAGAVVDEIKQSFDSDTAKTVDQYLALSGEPLEKLAKVEKLLDGSSSLAAGVANLRSVFGMLDAAGYSAKQVVFDPSIARGLDYYTGIIFETFLKGAENLGSVCSGGRYDNLVEALGGPDLPAVGTSIGVDRLIDGLKMSGKTKTVKTSTQVLVVNFAIDNTADYMKIATILRSSGIATEMYYDAAKLGKQISFADKMGIPYVVLMGPDELAKKIAIVKTLESGEQTEVPIDELAETIGKMAAKET